MWSGIPPRPPSRFHLEDRFEFDGDVATLRIVQKNGAAFAVLFDADFARWFIGLGYRVHLVFARKRYVYAFVSDYTGRGKRRRTILLHRIVANAPDGLLVDHDNHNTLDNRRHNLKVVTNSRNLLNRSGPTTANTSGARGCYYRPHAKAWCAQIRVGGKTRHLGYFKSLDEAKKAHSAAVQRLLKTVA